MITIHLLLILAAIVCFGLKAFNINNTKNPIDFFALAFMFLTIAFLVPVNR